MIFNKKTTKNHCPGCPRAPPGHPGAPPGHPGDAPGIPRDPRGATGAPWGKKSSRDAFWGRTFRANWLFSLRLSAKNGSRELVTLS